MLCPSCQNFRPANNEPCPWCGLPAAPAGGWSNQSASFTPMQDQQNFEDSWGGPVSSLENWNATSGQLPFATDSWQDPAASSGVQQLAFPEAGESSFWSQTADSANPQGGTPSLLPVPYQPQRAPDSAVMVMPNGFPTIGSNGQAANSMLPALPDQEVPVYVPPMYTKPRPIIPRYRAISGLLSMIIVFALLCGGAGYFAQVTGKLAPLEHFFGLSKPSAVGSGAHMLPAPSMQQTPGPGNKVITSVGLGMSVDPSSHLVPVYENKFVVGERIWIACNVNTPGAGTVTVKWFTNKSLYYTQTQNLTAKQSVVLDFYTSFGTPAEGRADIYWNNDLAETILFVVEPDAQ